MKHSTISQHQRIGNELVPPFLQNGMDEKIRLNSWSRERLPEYLWIGLLRDSCKSKEEYFKKFYYLKEFLLNKYEEPEDKFSNILKMNRYDKNIIFDKIKEYFGDYVLEPLIVVSYFDKELREKFYNIRNNNDSRISKIQLVVEKMYERQEEFAMDVRYSVIILKLNKMRITSNNRILIDALGNYPRLKYDEPIMSIYITSLSAFEGVDCFFNSNGYNYSKYFYEEMYLMTDCNPVFLVVDENEYKQELVDKLEQLRKLIIKSNEIKYDNKRDVIVGSITYIYKLIKEIVDNNLGNSIISRFVLRTVCELYVNTKFMCMQSKEEPEIWESFKDYGCGKYKSIYKKVEEGKVSSSMCTHFNSSLLKIFTNEAKNEEFIKIKFGNFADKNGREKFQSVGEKEIYDAYYDYDSCFSHAYWTAIRESSLLLCDNATHNYHCVPDIDNQQKMLCCYKDLVYVLNKIIVLMQEEIGGKDSD